MNRLKILVATFLAFVLLAVIAFNLNLFSTNPTLTIHLRCDKDVSGEISATMISSDSETNKAESFDLKTVCKAGKIKLSNYEKEKSIRFKVGSKGKASELTSKYGHNIHSDKKGFYTILKISKNAPFIAHEQL